MRRDVTFISQGADLSGWFFVPQSPPPWSLVVMAHGFSATRQMTADRYAAVMCASGLAVLLYDHYGFGASGGEPRRQINTWLQARGYMDAITYGSGLEGVDPRLVAVWGDSLSGGEALVVAAVDERVAALVVQVPALGAAPPPADPDGAMYRAFTETLRSGEVAASGADVHGPMPVVSDDPMRRPSALQPLTAYRWFIEYGGRLGSGWMNDVTRAQPKTPVAWHPGLCARHVACPALFIVAPQDEMAAAVPAVARAAYEQLAGPKEWLEIDGGHFGLLYYPSAEFERASSAQARFLCEHLYARR